MTRNSSVKLNSYRSPGHNVGDEKRACRFEQGTKNKVHKTLRERGSMRTKHGEGASTEIFRKTEGASIRSSDDEIGA